MPLSRKLLIKYALPAVILVLLSGVLLSRFLIPHIRSEQQKVALKAKAITLNHLMPDFRSLADFISKRDKPEGALSKAYLNYYQQVVSYFSDLSDAHGLLGFCYYYNGQVNEARDAYQKAIDLNPHYFWHYYDLGLIYLQNGQYQAAQAVFVRALKTDPRRTVQILYNSKIYHQILSGFEDQQYNPVDNLRPGYEDCQKLLVLAGRLSDSEVNVNLEQFDLKVF